MARFAILAVALLTLVGASTTRGEDSDEVKKLKSRVELLEKQLKLSEKENELLKREVEQLKAGPSTAKKGDSTKKSSLSERLTEGTTVTGTYMYPNFPGESGTSTLTITQRDKNTVKGKYGAKNRKTGEVYPGFDFEGEIDGVRLIAKSTGNAKKRSMTLSLKGDELEGTLVLLDTKGTAKLAFTLEK